MSPGLRPPRPEGCCDMPVRWRMALVGAALMAATPSSRRDGLPRRTSLGAVVCRETAPRPMPRPVYRSTVQGLDRVQEPPRPDDDAREFIPARRTRGLGSFQPDRPAGPGLCRADALGNLSCR